MSHWFAILRRRGPGWDPAQPLRRQRLWDEHAAYVDALEAEGVLRMAGPLAASPEVLLIMQGEDAEAIEARLAEDPWTAAALLATVWIRPWSVLVGRDALAGAAA